MYVGHLVLRRKFNIFPFRCLQGKLPEIAAVSLREILKGMLRNLQELGKSLELLDSEMRHLSQMQTDGSAREGYPAGEEGRGTVLVGTVELVQVLGGVRIVVSWGEKAE